MSVLSNCNTNKNPQDVDLEGTTGNKGESDREISIPDTTSTEDGELQNVTNSGSDAIEQDSRGFGEKQYLQKNAESSLEQRGLKRDRISPHHVKELAASAIDPDARQSDGSPGGKNEGNTQTGCINDDETQRILKAFGKRPVASQEAQAKDSRSNSDRKSSEHGNRSRIDLLLRDGRMASNHQGGCKAEILREVSTAHSLGENNHRAVRGGVK